MKRRFLPLMVGTKSYIEKIQALSPIAYWPLNETSGTAVINYGTLGTAANGSYTGVTLASTTAPGGTLAPYWDGTNDSATLTSTALNTAFNRSEFTMMAWAKMDFLWSEAIYREVMAARVNNTNRAYFIKLNANGQFAFLYNGNSATTKQQTWTGQTSTGWMHFAMTVSVANNRVYTYINGVQFDSPNSGITAFVGNPTTTLGVDGVSSRWKGWIAHSAIWNRPLTTTEITNLYTLGGV